MCACCSQLVCKRDTKPLSRGLRYVFKNLESIIYFDYYVVLDASKTGFTVGTVISEDAYQKYSNEDEDFVAGIGAEAIRELLQQIELNDLCFQLRQELKTTSSELKRKKISKRLEVIEAFRQSGPELTND